LDGLQGNETSLKWRDLGKQTAFEGGFPGYRSRTKWRWHSYKEEERRRKEQRAWKFFLGFVEMKVNRRR